MVWYVPWRGTKDSPGVTRAWQRAPAYSRSRDSSREGFLEKVASGLSVEGRVGVLQIKKEGWGGQSFLKNSKETLCTKAGRIIELNNWSFYSQKEKKKYDSQEAQDQVHA